MIKYTQKKRGNQAVAVHIEPHLSYKTYNAFLDCGSWLEMKADKELANMKLNRANFCNNRFCPMCSWRLSQKDALRVSVVMDYIEAEHEKAFIMVTFTAPNVKGDKLPDEVTRYNKAFKNLCKRDVVIRMNQGYVRKLEITYNEKRDDFHPHFHVIFAVNKSYFTSRYYIKQETWLNLWREVMDDDSITQVFVQKIVKSEAGAVKTEVKRNKAVNEIAKYTAKDADYCHSQEVFDHFYAALKGRQVMTYNGLFTAANRMYKNDELEEYKEIDKTDYYWIVFYRWAGLDYTEKHCRQMTIEEQWKLPLRIEELPDEW